MPATHKNSACIFQLRFHSQQSLAQKMTDKNKNKQTTQTAVKFCRLCFSQKHNYSFLLRKIRSCEYLIKVLNSGADIWERDEIGGFQGSIQVYLSDTTI